MIPQFNTTESHAMHLLITLGRVTFEVTRSDILLRIGKREVYWSWSQGVGPLIETTPN